MDSVPQVPVLRRSFIRFPTQVEFGVGMLSRLGEFAADYGKRAYCLFDPFFRGSAAAQTVLEALHAVGIETFDCYEVRVNPRAADIGKAVSFLMTNGRGAWDYTVKENEFYYAITEPPLPFVAIPTTAGTGSEATIYSVINNPEIRRKCTIRSFALYPKLAIIDPELTVGMPPMLTALTGIDTFAHAFESYTYKNATLYSKMVAMEAMRLFAENIETCVADGKNLEARSKMAFASLLGGLAISHSPTTLPHIIGQYLSGWVDAPHGGSLAVCLAQVIRWTLPYGQSEFAQVARVLSPALVTAPEAEAAAALPDLVDALFLRLMGNQRVTMKTYGMDESRAGECSSFIFHNYQADMSNYLRVPTQEELDQIIAACL